MNITEVEERMKSIPGYEEFRQAFEGRQSTPETILVTLLKEDKIFKSSPLVAGALAAAGDTASGWRDRRERCLVELQLPKEMVEMMKHAGEMTREVEKREGIKEPLDLAKTEGELLSDLVLLGCIILSQKTAFGRIVREMPEFLAAALGAVAEDKV